jgi:hypothetical protein
VRSFELITLWCPRASETSPVVRLVGDESSRDEFYSPLEASLQAVELGGADGGGKKGNRSSSDRE